MDHNQLILKLIKDEVEAHSPGAEVILFGSRARGDARPGSDWDVLVIVDRPKLTPSDRRLDCDLWDKGLDYGEEINTQIRTRQKWDETISLFKHNVNNEGIRL